MPNPAIHIYNPAAAGTLPLRLVLFGLTGSLQVAVWSADGADAADDESAIRAAASWLPDLAPDLELDGYLVAQPAMPARYIETPQGFVARAEVHVVTIPEGHPLFWELLARSKNGGRR